MCWSFFPIEGNGGGRRETMMGGVQQIAQEINKLEAETGQVEVLLRAYAGDLQCSDIGLLVLVVGSISPSKAQEVFDIGLRFHYERSTERSLLYASMISVFIDNGDLEKGLELFVEVTNAHGPPPSWELLSETFCAVLTACENSDQLKSALLLHNHVVHVCLSSDEIAAAVDVLDCIHGKGLRADASVYHAVLRSCEQHSDPSAAIETFLMMQMVGLDIDQSVCHDLMKTMIESNMINMGLELLQEAERAGIKLEAKTYCSLITGLMEFGDPSTVSRLFEHMGYMNITPEPILASKFVEYCLKTGWTELGRHWFRAFESAGISIEMEQPRELVLVMTQRMVLRSH